MYIHHQDRITLSGGEAVKALNLPSDAKITKAEWSSLGLSVEYYYRQEPPASS